MEWGERRIRDLLVKVDDLGVALDGARDLMAEMHRDVEDGRPWDDGTRRELVERLAAILGT